MLPILSRAQVRAYDAHAIEECRVPSLVLMENAGRGAADRLMVELRASPAGIAAARVVIVAGTGNNGGDGFVVARHLAAGGVAASVILAGREDKLAGDARANHDAFVELGGDCTVLPPGTARAMIDAELDGATLIVDALFGTGLDRAIEGFHADVIGAIRAQPRSDERTPVAALRTVARVAQALVHQGVEDRADLGQGLAWLVRLERQRVARQRWDDDGESIGRQQRDQLHELEHRAGPTVREQQRLGFRAGAAHMQEVDVDAVDARLELRPGIERRFGGTPVEAVAPVVHQLAHEGQRGAVGPGCGGRLVGPQRAVQARVQVVDRRLRHGKLERADVAHDSMSGCVLTSCSQIGWKCSQPMYSLPTCSRL